MKSSPTTHNCYEEAFRITTLDADMHGNAKLPALCNFLQEIAGNHAHNLNWGLQELLKKDLAWVLSRFRVKLYNAPQMGDVIRIKTWPVGLEGAFALRDFQIFNQNRGLIAEASSAWLIVNTNNHFPQRPNSIISTEDYQGNQKVFKEKWNKIPPIKDSNKLDQVKVRFSDLDINRHVNNVKYIKWLVDSCPTEFQMKQRIAELEINYLQEAYLEDELSISGNEMEEGKFHCSIKNSIRNTEHCRALLKWTKN